MYVNRELKQLMSFNDQIMLNYSLHFKILFIGYEGCYYIIKLSFYKKQQTTVKREKDFNANKIVTLQKQIERLSNKISETEKNYSKFNTATFDVNEVISRLKKDEQLLKYYVCSNSRNMM